MLRSFLSLALIATLAAMVPGVSVAWATTAAHPAGCHRHAPELPSHAPVSFECCVNGHHAAMPSAIFRNSPATSQFAACDDSHQFSVVAAPTFEVRVNLSSSPPGAAPLRI
jgi:hypothetical protein